MSALGLLDVAIGLVVVYLLFSIVCSAANELLAGLMNGRGRHLAAGIGRLLGDEDLQRRFFAHSLVESLGDGKRTPSYIPASTFAVALLDVIAPAAADWTRSGAQLGESIARLPEGSRARRALTLLMDRAGGDVEKLHHEIEAWFESSMNRVSGAYKRSAQVTTIVLALVVSLLANADTIRLAHVLAQNQAMREALVAYGKNAVEHPPAGVHRRAAGEADSGRAGGADTAVVAVADSAALHHVINAISSVEQLGLPLGWSPPPSGFGGWLSALIGILITAFAVSLGAQFWFDVLVRFINLRSSGPQPAARPKSPAAAPAAGGAPPGG
jgi:hypothetical protein